MDWEDCGSCLYDRKRAEGIKRFSPIVLWGIQAKAEVPALGGDWKLGSLVCAAALPLATV